MKTSILDMKIASALYLLVGDITEYVFHPGKVVGMLLNETMIERPHQLESSLVQRGVQQQSYSPDSRPLNRGCRQRSMHGRAF